LLKLHKNNNAHILIKPIMATDDCNESVGISEYISRIAGFQGILKHRFSDFVVREVSISGEVTHLDSTEDLGGWESKYFKGKGGDEEGKGCRGPDA
jgi:hypothetical protein